MQSLHGWSAAVAVNRRTATWPADCAEIIGGRLLVVQAVIGQKDVPTTACYLHKLRQMECNAPFPIAEAPCSVKSILT